jgi:hypothetical protein
MYTLIVDPVNDAPVLTLNGDESTDEDTNLTGISVVFTDPDAGDLHTITVVSDDSNVTMDNLSGHISGSVYDLVLAADWHGSAEITVTVTDNGDGALNDVDTYTLTVDPVNDAPILTEIGAQGAEENETLTDLPVVFTDADAGDTHVITVVSDNANVTVANISGNTSGSTYDLVPAAAWNGSAEITVTVTDNAMVPLFDAETYIFTVNSVNDAPVITEIGDQNTDEDMSLTGLAVNFTDADAGDTHSITVVSAEANVTVVGLSGNISGSTYDLVPAANWSGMAQITVTVTDDGDGALFDTEIYTLTVDPTNDAPDSLLISKDTIDEKVIVGTPIGLFSTMDIDVGDVHTYTFILDGGVFDVDNDAFTIDGDTLKSNVEFDFETKSSYSILVQSDDGQGGTISQNFTIIISDIDETSVGDIYNNPSFNVYPVPAIDFVTVEVDNPENKEMLLEIYSNTGRLMHAEAIFHKNRVDLSGFTDGMYIIQIKGERVFGTRKIVVKDR